MKQRLLKEVFFYFLFSFKKVIIMNTKKEILNELIKAEQEHEAWKKVGNKYLAKKTRKEVKELRRLVNKKYVTKPKIHSVDDLREAVMRK